MNKQHNHTDTSKLLGHLQLQLVTKHQGFKREAVISAQNSAEHNRPGISETSWIPYTASINAFYASLKADVRLALKGDASIQQLPADIATYNLKIDAVQTEIDSYDEQLRQLKIDKRQKGESGEPLYLRGKQINSIIITGEIVWLTAYFTGLADSLIIALLSAATVAAVQTFAVEKVTQKIKELENTRTRRRAARLAVLCFATWSLLIGAARYGIVSSLSPISLPFWVSNPFIFAFVNFLLISACALVVLVNFPMIKQISDIEDLKKLRKNEKTYTKKKNELLRQKNLLLEARNYAVKLSKDITHDQRTLCSIIDNFYREAVGWFIQENCTRRKDGQVPPLFETMPEPPHDNEMFEFIKTP